MEKSLNIQINLFGAIGGAIGPFDRFRDWGLLRNAGDGFESLKGFLFLG